MDTIQKLAKCDFGREIFHSDGEGHVQVEYRTDSLDPFDSPHVLLGQVEQEGLWPEFLEMARSKDDEWIRSISRVFSGTEHYATSCFVEFLSILSSRDAQIEFIQDSPMWLWDEKTAPMLEMVIDKAAQLIASTPDDSLEKEIDLSILNSVISRLEAMK